MRDRRGKRWRKSIACTTQVSRERSSTDQSGVPEAVGRFRLLRLGQRDQIRDLHGTRQLRANRRKRLKSRRVHDRLPIRQRIDERAPLRAAVPEALQRRSIRVVDLRRCGAEVVEGLQLLRRGIEAVVDVAGPKRALCKGTEREGRHNAEVVGAAAEREPEVAVCALRGGDEGAVGEDDFEGEDIVAAEAGAGAEVADTSCLGMCQPFVV